MIQSHVGETRLRDGAGRRDLHRHRSGGYVAQPSGRAVRDSPAHAFRRLRLPDSDGGSNRRHSRPVPRSALPPPDVAGRPDRHCRGPRGGVQCRNRFRERGPDSDRRDSRGRRLRSDGFGGRVRGAPGRTKAAPLEILEPSARRDHRPDRAALRHRRSQVDRHHGMLLLGRRDGIRVRRDPNGPGRRGRDRRFRRPRPPDVRRIQRHPLGRSGAVPAVRPKP